MAGGKVGPACRVQSGHPVRCRWPAGGASPPVCIKLGHVCVVPRMTNTLLPTRYRLEYEEGRRSCLNRVLAHDEAAHRAMVLCVVGVQVAEHGHATLEARTLPSPVLTMTSTVHHHS